MNAERGACSRFLDQVLRQNKDQVFILQFDMTVQMRQALTSSLRKLDEALAFVDTPTRRELQNQYGGGTLLYDAVVTASTDVMKTQGGRKALRQQCYRGQLPQDESGPVRTGEARDPALFRERPGAWVDEIDP